MKIKTANTRQIAFLAAFVLPMGKLLESPSILASHAGGDILLPALLQYLLQTLLLLGALYAAAKSKRPLWERLQEKFGKVVKPLTLLFALYYLFAAILPLLDMEKFVYAAFFDTAPTTFSFGAFFVLLAFLCSRSLQSVGRFADLSLFLFLIPFLLLVAMGCFETDLTKLLPLFGTPLPRILRGVERSVPHFSDVALLLPLIATKPYEKGEGAKITLGYAVGALLTLLFFAVFFGIYSSVAPREHYAFSKIAQYFPALAVVGRVDLILVYLLSCVLLVYTSLPLVYATELTSSLLPKQPKRLISALLSLLFFLFTLFCNRYYGSIYRIISVTLTPIFYFIAYLLPAFLLFLPKKEDSYV